ncbi:expressed unknown protein [Ectocarpus siliculosus]|uniref:GRAM domain-containing protein n=1 Tax=Ectocarpus siliculosus TaxID=2880 RepID=D7FI06_ECTSI|nr:expressed unknown protein [Ectocarpus siliculosus]|eukprot:CBJ49017.1 expressed unknown protein [Ectocarpus siliculosus]
MDGGAKAAGGGAEVVFRKVAAGESRLWETKRIQHADLNRLHLRSIESILDPTVSADSIIGAVAYAVTSHGLRVTQREQGRIVAQRVEAPYLASVSSGSWRSGSGQEREEWRMVVANVGVSKGVGEGKMVERVLSVSFMTDPVPKPTDLAGKGAAAVSSLLGSVGSIASTFSSSMTSSSKDGPAGSSAGSAGAAAGKAGAASGAASSLTAVEIANVRSNQRADSLLQAVVAELGRVGWQGAVDRRTGTAATAAAVVGPRGTKPSPGSPGPEQQKAAEKGEDAGDGARPGERAASMPQEVLVLAPFDGSNSSSSSASGSVASASALGPLSPEEEGREGEKAEGPPRQEEDQETGVPEGGVATAGAGADAVVAAAAATVVEVGLCLQFVEGLCARAEEYSRHDAAETWRPLQDTVSRLERDNATLRSLLEPKYRAVGAAPPPVPIWSGRRSFGETYGSSVGSAATNVGNAPSKRVVELLRSTPLFVIDGKQVKAKVVSTAAAAAAASGAAKRDGERQIDGSSSATGSAASDLGGSRRHALLVRAAVKALTEVVGRVCESREEAFLKARLPGAQAYTVELERYGSTIAGGSALRATASSPERDWASAGSVEVDDDLWRLFAAQETRLYSSSAALGKKPGRLYVTYSTLWFHSKVLGFESRHVLPLAEVVSITLLGTALDLSSSLVIATNSGGVPGELMFIFPGQKRRQVEPLEVLLRQLAVLAAKERAATAEATEATAAASPDVSS